jgi:hypothetical protein
MIHGGKTPYSQIAEINLPGSYLVEYLGMSVFGWGPHGLRLYDGFLCLTLCCSSFLLGNGNRKASLCYLLGSFLFVMIHLQDGRDQAGQRDFVLAVLVVAALCALVRHSQPNLVSLFFYELLIGLTLIIKPTLLPLALLPLVSIKSSFSFNRDRLRALSVALIGLLFAPMLAFVWLCHYHALHSFVEMLQSIALLHSRLGRKSLGFLLAHSTSPVVVLYALGAGVAFLMRHRMTRPEKYLVYASVCGLISYIYQGKGFPYQRYPFLAVSLLFIFTIFSKGLGSERWSYGLSLIGLLYASIWLAPRYAATVRSFDTVAPFQEALSKELLSHDAGVSVQCLDTFGGCINTLYDLRIPQATGYLYDCYFYGAQSKARDEYRARFLAAFTASRPEVVILTNERCFDPIKSFGRVVTWPDFAEVLNRRYVVVSQWQSNQPFRAWSRAEVPNAFKVYIRK